MIGLIQRVAQAKVDVNGQTVGKIGTGILLLLGVEKDDTPEKAQKLCDKILNYRIFPDELGKMNLNLQQANGELLIVSQFTLVADTRKGSRPSFSSAAPPILGLELYQHFIQLVHEKGVGFATGEFGADMQVSLVNDGPVTFHLQV